MPYASLMSGTRMGNGNKVYQGAVVAAVPQDFAYTGEDTLAYIGNNNVIRENAVIIRGTHAGHATSVGDGTSLWQVHVCHMMLKLEIIVLSEMARRYLVIVLSRTVRFLHPMC